ncbi:MAG: M48 family metallopeptidase [Zoogloeaceae bacterium]|nr:M48 family metallopeptidase [Zoogloeaceae bacterium]
MASSSEPLHRLELGGVCLEYRLVRSARRTLGIRVDGKGVRVNVPLRARQGEIEAVLRQQGDWLLARLAEWKNRSPAAALAEGKSIPWLGQPLLLRRAEDSTRSRLKREEGVLELRIPEGHDLASCFVRFAKTHARALFLERLAHYAARLGVATPPLVLSSAKSRWGSCNSRGEIRLCWRLIHFPPGLVDYVVAHELAHLREMNHSPRFWAEVEALYPDWRRARAEIRRLAQTLPEIAGSN